MPLLNSEYFTTGCLNISAEETCGLGADFKMTPGNITANIFFIIVATLGLPGNILVIIVCRKNMSVMYRVYMLALAIVDTIICMFYIVFSSIEIFLVSDNIMEIRCPFSIYNVAFCTCLTYSIFVLTLISIDRYLAVQSPIKHRTRARKFRVALVTLPLLSLVVSTILALLEFLWIPYLNEIAALLPFLTCSIIIIIMYTLLSWKLYTRQKKRETVVASIVVSPVPRPTPPHRNGKLEKLAKTLFIVTVAFLVSWVPFWLVTLGVGLPCALKETFILNSAMNPIIYAFMWEPFRVDIQTLLCSKSTKVHPFDETS